MTSEFANDDYELRNMIEAYRHGKLDAEGQELMDEALAEYGLRREDVK